MKRTWRGIGSILLTLCMVFTMLPGVALAEGTGSTEELETKIESWVHDGTGTLAAVVNDQTVTVTGQVYNVTQPLQLNIGSGVTVVWEASLKASEYTAYSLIQLSGNGTFEVVHGGEIVSGRSAIGGGTCTVKVSGGLVSGGTNAGARAISSSAACRVEIDGGTVQAEGTNCIAIATPATVKVNGGKIIAKGGSNNAYAIGSNNPANDQNTLTIEINGGTVTAAGGATAIKTAGSYVDNKTLVKVTGGSINVTGGGNAIDTANVGPVQITGGEIHVESGYGIYTAADVTVTDATISATTGIAIDAGNITVNGSSVITATSGKAIKAVNKNIIIEDNALVSATEGNAIFADGGGSITINGGTVQNIVSGDAIQIKSSGTIRVLGGTISANYGRRAIFTDSSSCIVIVSGGTIKGGISPVTTPKDQDGLDGKNVYLTELNGLPENTTVTSLSKPSGYGVNGVTTDEEGNLYFYLPSGEDIDFELVADGKTYTGKGNITEGDNNVAMKTDYSGTPITTTKNVLFNQAQTDVEVDMSSLISDIAGAAVSAAAEETDASNLIDNVSYSDNKVTFDVAEIGTVGTEATINVTITSTNYRDFTATITVKTVAKGDAEVSFSGTIPTAKIYGDGNFTITATASNSGVNGVWTFTSSNPDVLQLSGTSASITVTILKSGSATITAKYESDTTLGEATTAAITVAKADLKVQPKSISIYKGDTMPTPVIEYVGLKNSDIGTDEAILSSGTLDMEIMNTDESGALAGTDTNGLYKIVFIGSPVFNDSEKYNITTGNGTLTISTKPSSCSGGGGGGSTTTQPAAPAADGAVTVNYTASNGTAVLSLPAAKVDDIIAKSTDGAAVIDLSKVSGVTAASLPKAAISAMNEAGLDVTVKLPAGTIILDEDAAASIVEQVTGSNLSIELQPVGTGSLTPAQQEAVQSGDIVLDINILSGSQQISSFDGALSIQVPYNGPQPVAVWYLNDAGQLEKLDCTFQDGVVSFDLDHLSLYVVGQDSKEADEEKPLIADKEPGWKNPFTDVKAADWFYAAVQYVNEKGLMAGTGNTTFSPHDNTTRGMIVTILYRLEGTPTVSTANPFDDVAVGQYYADAVVWAAENQIVSGYGNAKFGPNDPITREQIAVIMMKYAQTKGYDVSARADLAKYSDTGAISGWAKEALAWANTAGLIQGDGSKLNPGGKAQRCQVASILNRFVDNIAK